MYHIGHVLFISEKKYIFTGTSGDIARPQTFASPYFPEEYALDFEEYTYIFQAATQDDFVTIAFDDWQLSPYSTIQVSLSVIFPSLLF